MKLALAIGYSGATLDVPIELIQHAERLGFDSVWTAEAYGSDAITPLAWIAAKTERIRLGTGIMQLAGRPPAMCAMQCMTVDALAGGGRMIAGLGVSGPQIVEGWYGQPWGKPYWRLRDYIEIMRKIFEREEPVAHEGREISLPYTGDGRHRARQAAALDHPRRPAAADLDGLGQGGHRRASPPSCATAGCRCTSSPAAWPSTGRGSRRASPGPGPPAVTRAGTTSRSRPRSACASPTTSPARSPRRSRASPSTSAAWAPAR